jgi:hypothetical protein
MLGNSAFGVNTFPSISWKNVAAGGSSAAFSTMSCDIQVNNPFIPPPGMPDITGNGLYGCPTFELNGPNSTTACPLSVSGLIVGWNTTQTGSPSIYTSADSVSSLYVASSSSITFQTPSFVAPPAVIGISSMNGVYMDWAKISSVVGAAP